MSRIPVLADVHGNLPALQATLAAARLAECDAIYHVGDAIAIGPQPAECRDLLLGVPNVQVVMGNHDSWFAHGLPRPQPVWADVVFYGTRTSPGMSVGSRGT